jgi:transcriptional regulator with XRE-family HTH domain
LDTELLGNRIRVARERLGLSQEELGTVVSKDQRAISQYENGKRKLSATDLPTFAQTLKVPLLYFFEGEAVLEDLDKAVLDEFRRLPIQEAKQAAIDLIHVLLDLLEPHHR